MQEQIQQRLQELRQEYQEGQRMLADLEARQAELRQTLLRISGAIQVLEELSPQSDASASQEIDVTEAAPRAPDTEFEVA